MLFRQISHPSIRAGLQDLARLTAHLGMAVLERTWRETTGIELPQAVREYIAGQIREKEDQP